MNGNFALTMDYAGTEVSEVQYRHDRAKYYNEVPGRDEFIAFCESLMEHESRCENVADDMLADYECPNCGELQADVNEAKEETERLEKKIDGLDSLLNSLEKYFEATEPRNETETQLLRKIQIELYRESYV